MLLINSNFPNVHGQLTKLVSNLVINAKIRMYRVANIFMYSTK